MTSNPYEILMPPTPFERSVDAAVEEENARYIEQMKDPACAAEQALTGERWAAWSAAEKAGGVHTVVLPVATAKAILAIAEGTYEGAFSAETMIASLKQRIGDR